MRPRVWNLLALLIGPLLACGEPETLMPEEQLADGGATRLPDASVLPPPPRCGALELNLPVTLNGPGAAHVLHALLHPAEREEVEPRLVPAEQLSVRVEGAAAAWQRGRLVARAPGVSAVHVEVGSCQLSSELEVLDHAPFAASLDAVSFGRGAGHGQSELPEVILGPPHGAGGYAGSLDVLSLGVGGRVRLGFGELALYDGPGPDFIVFENPFWIAGGAAVFAEPGQVSVIGPDAEVHAFPCDPRPPHAGCAGLGPVLSHPDNDRPATDLALAGGDAFDLEGFVPLALAVLIEDVATATTGTNSGFDLDAIALVHAWPKDVIALEAALDRLELAEGQISLVPPVVAVRAGGERLRGLPARVRAEDPELLRLDGPLLTARRSGSTRLVFEAGPFQATLEVEVRTP